MPVFTSGFSRMKQLGVFYSSLDGMLVLRRVTALLPTALTHMGGEKQARALSPQPGLELRPLDL